jgi:hypothetical protein
MFRGGDFSIKIFVITIQINYQPDATIFQFFILAFIYSSTCFGRFPAHHQELMTAAAASGFTFVSW